MITVGLVTSWNEQCGIAQYAHNLTQSVPQDGILIDVIARDRWSTDAIMRTNNQIIHVNYEPGLFRWIQLHDLYQWRQAGKKIIFTWHTSQEHNNKNPMHQLIDRVVMHEKTTDPGIIHIPQGIEEHDTSGQEVDYDLIGTAGFPFPWKGFPEVAEAARILGSKVLIIAPASPHYDTYLIEGAVRNRHPDPQYVTDWMDTGTVVKLLATCGVIVFAYHGGQYGISGAVRMGISAQRPLVLNRNRQFRDLFEYDDEIYFAPSPDPNQLADAIRIARCGGNPPHRVLADMNWTKVGQMYRELYLSLGA